MIVSVPQYQSSRADAVMVALSTQVASAYFGDCDIDDWQTAGLPMPTKAKGVVRTIEQEMITRHVGNLTGSDLQRVQQSIRDILGL